MTTKLQIKNKLYGASRADREQEKLGNLRGALTKDFKRLEKLMMLDHPKTKVDFDYLSIDEGSNSIVISIADEQFDLVSSYLTTNYYSFIRVGGVSDSLLKINLLSLLLAPNRIFYINETKRVAGDLAEFPQRKIMRFDGFGKKYRGYLDESPGRPGLHHDYTVINCTPLTCGWGEPTKVETSEIMYEDNKELFAEIDSLDPEWKSEMMETRSFIGSLPPTKFFEGDIVTITDKQHPNYSENEAAQCLVFRIVWDVDPVKYQIKLPKTNEIAVMREDQLALREHGVTRLFYNGKAPTQWKSLQSEAEFYLMLGMFMYHYNPLNDSYHWTMDQAKKAIKEKEGHGVLRWKNINFLISFIVDEDTVFEPDEVAEATLAADLVLRF